MKKILVIFVFFLLNSFAFASSISYKSLLDLSNNHESSSSESTQKQTSQNIKNLNNFIKVLKDSEQRNIFIKSLEVAVKTKTNVVNKEKEKQKFSNSTTINKIEKIDIYTRSVMHNVQDAIIGLHLYNYSVSKYYLLQKEVKSIYNKNITDLLIWSTVLLLLIVLQLFLEKLFFRLERKPYKKYQIPLSQDSNSSVPYIYGKIINFILTILPSVLSFTIISVTFIFLQDITFFSELIRLLGLFALFRVLKNFMDSIFYKITYKPLIAFKANIVFALYSFYIFLVLHDLLAKANSTILIRINLIIFIIFFATLFFKIRKHVVKTLYELVAANEKQYILLWSNVKNYYIILIAVIIFTINYSKFILDYNNSVDFFVRFLITLFQVSIVYILQRLLSFLFKRFIIRKTEEDLNLLTTTQSELKDSYKILNIKPLWNYFEVLVKVGFSLFYLYVIDHIWELGIIAYVKNILNMQVVDSLITIFIGLSSLLLFTLFLLVGLQYFLIRKTKVDGDVVVKKYLTLFTLCRNPYRIIFTIIMVIIILSSVGLSITTLLASTGLITLVLALGSKDILQNLFNGMVFLMEDSFALNDYIEIDGKSGKVEDISMVYLRLRDLDGKLHMIPFKTITIITNYTKFYSYAFMEIGISYDSDVEKAKLVLHNIYDEIYDNLDYKRFITSPLIMTGVVSLGDFAVTIRCKVQTIPGQNIAVRAIFLQRIKEEFSANNIEIPFPYRTIVHKQGTL